MKEISEEITKLKIDAVANSKDIVSVTQSIIDLKESINILVKEVKDISGTIHSWKGALSFSLISLTSLGGGLWYFVAKDIDMVDIMVVKMAQVQTQVNYLQNIVNRENHNEKMYGNF